MEEAGIIMWNMFLLEMRTINNSWGLQALQYGGHIVYSVLRISAGKKKKSVL